MQNAIEVACVIFLALYVMILNAILVKIFPRSQYVQPASPEPRKLTMSVSVTLEVGTLIFIMEVNVFNVMKIVLNVLVMT